MKRSILFLLMVLFAGAPVIKAMEKVQDHQSDSSDSDSSESEGGSVFTETRTNIYASNGSGTHADEDDDIKRTVLYSNDSDYPEDSIQVIVDGSSEIKPVADELDQDADDEGEDGSHWSGGEDLHYGDDEAKDVEPTRSYFDKEEGSKKLEQCYLILHHVLPQLLIQAEVLGVPVGQLEDLIGEDFEDIDPKKVAKFLKKCHLKLKEQFGDKIFSKFKKRSKKGKTRADVDVKKIVKITEEIIHQFIHVYTKIKFAKKGQKRSMVTEANVQVLANFSLVLLDVFKKGLKIKMNDAALTSEERGIFKRWHDKLIVASVIVAAGLGVGGLMGWCSVAGYIPFLQAYLPEAMTCAVTGS